MTPAGRDGGHPRQRDDDPRRGWCSSGGRCELRDGAQNEAGARHYPAGPSRNLARPVRCPRGTRGNPVVTGPKIGLRASRAMGRAKKIFDARVMMRWYGASHTSVATGDVAGTKSPACESSD